MNKIRTFVHEWLTATREAPGLALFVVLVWGFFIWGIGSAGYHRYLKYRASETMKGKVLGDMGSKVFYVPTCPNYSSIDEKKRIAFARASDAIDAGFTKSAECAESIELRLEVESIHPPPEADPDGPLP